MSAPTSGVLEITLVHKQGERRSATVTNVDRRFWIVFGFIGEPKLRFFRRSGRGAKDAPSWKIDADSLAELRARERIECLFCGRRTRPMQAGHVALAIKDLTCAKCTCALDELGEIVPVKRLR